MTFSESDNNASYWSNRAPLFSLGKCAQHFFDHLDQSGVAAVVLHLPKVISQTTGYDKDPSVSKHYPILDPDYWEEQFIFWRDMSMDQRESILDTSLEAKIIGLDDPREALRGQYGVFARQPLPPHQIIGTYSGCYCLDEDTKIERQLMGSLTFGRYALLMNTKLGNFVISAYNRGNVCLCMNAYTTHIPGTMVMKQNATFFMVEYKGCPCVFIVTTCPIEPGEEILVDYSFSYWENLAKVYRAWKVCQNVASAYDIG